MWVVPARVSVAPPAGRIPANGRKAGPLGVLGRLDVLKAQGVNIPPSLTKKNFPVQYRAVGTIYRKALKIVLCDNIPQN